MPDLFILRLEAIAVAARLRRVGDHAEADLVEQWANSRDLTEQAIETRLR